MNDNVKFGISVYKINKGMWSFGMCFSHEDQETYLYINLFKWSISIGKLYKWG